MGYLLRDPAAQRKMLNTLKWPSKNFKVLFLMMMTFFMATGCATAQSEQTQAQANKLGVNPGDKFTVNELESKPFGKALFSKFDEIGIDKSKITEIVVEVPKDTSISMRITLPEKRIWPWLECDEGIWSVKWIKNYETSNYYYLNDKDKYVGDKILAEDIYSYKTDKVIEKANEKKVKEYWDKLEQEREEYRKEEEKKDQTARKKQIAEIYSAYKKSDLKANDKYKGNRYELMGTIETIEEDGLINVVFDEIGLVITTKYNGKSYMLFCKFDETEREKLKEFNVGDTIKFTGECLDENNWIQCEVD